MRGCDRRLIPVRHTGGAVGVLLSFAIRFSGPAYGVPKGRLPWVSVRQELWEGEPIPRCVSHTEGL